MPVSLEVVNIINTKTKQKTQRSKVPLIYKFSEKFWDPQRARWFFRQAGRECRVQIANPPGGGTAPAVLQASALEQLATADTRIQLGQLPTQEFEQLFFLKISFKKSTRIKICLNNSQQLLITDQCCGSGMFIPDPGSEFFPSRIPDPNFFHFGSRISITEFKYFNPKKLFLSSLKYDPGCSCSSRIRILIFNPSRIPDPGVKKAPDPIRVHNTVTDTQQYMEKYIGGDCLSTDATSMKRNCKDPNFVAFQINFLYS